MVILIILGEIGVAVMATVHHATAVTEVSARLLHRLRQEYGMPGSEQFTIALDYVQYQVIIKK